MEAVLTGSRVALLGLIEMLEVSTGDTVLSTKANTIIIVEGSRFPPRDILDTLDLHMLGTSHPWVEPDEWMNNRQEPPTKVM